MMPRILFRADMDRIYAPWRSDYFDKKPAECIFCKISKNPQEDLKNFVFYRDDFCYGVMNLYPYTAGHLLFIPHLHLDSPEKLKEEIWLHLHKISQKAIAMLYEFGAEGINMGMNIKKQAGAGIPEHLHLHLLPRYNGDTNFITSIANSRVYGTDFETIYKKIQNLAKMYLK